MSDPLRDVAAFAQKQGRKKISMTPAALLALLDERDAERRAGLDAAWAKCVGCDRIWHTDGRDEHAAATGHYPDGSPLVLYS